MSDGLDRIRLRCPHHDSFDVWGTLRSRRPFRFDPDDGLEGMRCPTCFVVCDRLVEVNGASIGEVDC